MKRSVNDFRHAGRLLKGQPAWAALDAAIKSLSRGDVISEQRKLANVGFAPKGGQTALNQLFAKLLPPERGWVPQPRLFLEPELRQWKLDFLRDRIGIEVSFNHAEAIPWQFTRLNIAGESERVIPESQIDVGIVITAEQTLKTWAHMDSAVGTFDAFSAWLREMKPILPIPIMLIGLSAEGWASTDVFEGTAKGTRRPPSIGRGVAPRRLRASRGQKV